MATTANDERKETFYPGVMKRVRFDDFKPLKDSQGFRRVKLTFSIPHNDGQVTGIPEWLDGPLRLVQKVNSGSKSWRGDVEIDGLKVIGYHTDTSEAPAIELVATVANAFSVRRTSTETPKGDVADVELTFSVYTEYSDRVWDWSKVAYGREFFAKFGTLQASFSFGKPGKDKDEDAGEPETEDERIERERREATSPAMDHLFDPKRQASGDVEKPEVDGITDDEDPAPVDPALVHDFEGDDEEEMLCDLCGKGLLDPIHATEQAENAGPEDEEDEELRGLSPYQLAALYAQDNGEDDDEDEDDGAAVITTAEGRDEPYELEGDGITDDEGEHEEPEEAEDSAITDDEAETSQNGTADEGQAEPQGEAEEAPEGGGEEPRDNVVSFPAPKKAGAKRAKKKA